MDVKIGDRVTDLEWLSKQWRCIVQMDLEDAVCDAVNEFCDQFRFTDAANIVSVYLNFVAPNNHEIVVDSDLEYVKLLIESGLVDYRTAGEGAVLISKGATRSGNQRVYLYTMHGEI